MPAHVASVSCITVACHTSRDVRSKLKGAAPSGRTQWHLPSSPASPAFPLLPASQHCNQRLKKSLSPFACSLACITMCMDE